MRLTVGAGDDSCTAHVASACGRLPWSEVEFDVVGDSVRIRRDRVARRIAAACCSRP